jgi:hypothetical protein
VAAVEVFAELEDEEILPSIELTDVVVVIVISVWVEEWLEDLSCLPDQVLELEVKAGEKRRGAHASC